MVIERFAWSFGVTTFLLCGVTYVTDMRAAREDLDRFETLRLPPDLPRGSPRPAVVDALAPPLAILRIPKIRLEVAVLAGTDDSVLRRGVGHIDHTAELGDIGNSGIAGHRDLAFRALRHIAAGDTVELETLDARLWYRVERVWIVDPNDVSVLEPTPDRALTLVTCYPFYFVGAAPQRFIVRARYIGQ